MKGIDFIPPELISLAGSESGDFVVESKRSQDPSKSISQILFGIAWVTILFATLGKDLFSNQNFFSIFTLPFPSNPNLVLFVFILFGFLPIIAGTLSLFKKGGIFLGTPTRLLHSINGKTQSIDWKNFTGNISILGNNITLEMKSGKTEITQTENGEETKTYSSRFISDTIYISGVDDVGEIIKICSQRIKENNPNLPNGVNFTSIPGHGIISFLLYLFKK